MSEIDVSKCEDFEKATCFDNDFDEIEFDYCKLFDEPCEDVRNNNRCTYKLKQQIQQLKAENEELKRLIAKQKNAKIQLSKLKDKEYKEFCDMKQYLDEIEEVANNGVKDDCGMPLDELSIILQLIKQAKECDNG